MRNNAPSPSFLIQAMRGTSFVFIMASALFMGIAFHLGTANGSAMTLFVIGLILAAIAEWMAKVDRAFGCLIGVIWIVLIAIVTAL